MMLRSDEPWEITYFNKILNLRTSKIFFLFFATLNPQNSSDGLWREVNQTKNKIKNQKNQDVIWARVSGQDTSSQFISRLVTRKKATCLQRNWNGWKIMTAHMGTDICMYKLMCNYVTFLYSGQPFQTSTWVHKDAVK